MNACVGGIYEQFYLSMMFFPAFLVQQFWYWVSSLKSAKFLFFLMKLVIFMNKHITNVNIIQQLNANILVLADFSFWLSLCWREFRAIKANIKHQSIVVASWINSWYCHGYFDWNRLLRQNLNLKSFKNRHGGFQWFRQTNRTAKTMRDYQRKWS